MFTNESYDTSNLDSSKDEIIETEKMTVTFTTIQNQKKETIIKTKEEETVYYNTLLENVENMFINGSYNTFNLDSGKDDKIIETEKMTVTFTTTQNQKNNLNDNISSIDLGECEILLRKYYNLTINETIYMKKLEINQKGFKIPKIEYDVYCKLNGTNLVKLNLSVCQK